MTFHSLTIPLYFSCNTTCTHNTSKRSDAPQSFLLCRVAWTPAVSVAMAPQELFGSLDGYLAAPTHCRSVVQTCLSRPTAVTHTHNATIPGAPNSSSTGRWSHAEGAEERRAKNASASLAADAYSRIAGMVFRQRGEKPRKPRDSCTLWLCTRRQHTYKRFLVWTKKIETARYSAHIVKRHHAPYIYCRSRSILYDFSEIRNLFQPARHQLRQNLAFMPRSCVPSSTGKHRVECMGHVHRQASSSLDAA